MRRAKEIFERGGAEDIATAGEASGAKEREASPPKQKGASATMY